MEEREELKRREDERRAFQGRRKKRKGRLGMERKGRETEEKEGRVYHKMEECALRRKEGRRRPNEDKRE